MKKHVNSGNGEEMFTCDVIVCILLYIVYNIVMLSTTYMHTCANKHIVCMYAHTHSYEHMHAHMLSH